MRSIIHTTAVIGCSISLTFSLLAILVLSCYREKTRILLIRQQQSITLALISIVMLSGFQGVQSEGLCRAVTALLQYFVLACFSWLAADQYFIFKSIVKMKPYVNLMKIFVAAWGFPLPFLIIQLLIGYLVDGKIGSVAYNCWGSDFVVLTLLIPAVGLSFASITMLSITVKFVIRTPAPTSYTKKKADNAIRYGIKASSVMIFITVTVWTFAHLLFWYPDYVNIQLAFALCTGFQGLFHFFFYCVFALELDIYISDKQLREAGVVDELPGNAESVKLSSINRRNIKNMESLRRQQTKRETGQFAKEAHDPSTMAKKDPSSLQKDKTTPTTFRTLSDPLPLHESASCTKRQVQFENKASMATTKLERAKSEPKEFGTEENEAFSSLLGDKATSPLPFHDSIQPIARLEWAKQNAKLANSTLLSGETILSSRGEKQRMESRRRSTLNCCAVPAHNTCAIASQAPMHPLANEHSARCEGNEQFPKHNMKRGSDYSLSLMVAAKSSTSLKPMRIEPFMNEPSRAPVSTLRHNTEDEFTKENEKLPVIEMMQIQPYRGTAKEIGQGELKGKGNQQQFDSPEVDSNSYVRRTMGQRQGSLELERAFSCMAADNRSRSCLSPKGKMTARKTVPSLKFTLNELESLYSNQDLGSAAERRVSYHSDSH